MTRPMPAARPICAACTIRPSTASISRVVYRVASGASQTLPPSRRTRTRRCLDAFGRLQADHHRVGQHGVGDQLDVCAHQACVPANRGIDVAGDRLHDVAAGERRPLDARLAHDVGDHVCGCEGRTKVLPTDGGLDDCGGFPAGVAGFGRPPLVQAHLRDVLVWFGRDGCRAPRGDRPAPVHRPPAPRPRVRSSSVIFASAAASTSAVRVLKRASSGCGMPASSAWPCSLTGPHATPSRRVSSARNRLGRACRRSWPPRTAAGRAAPATTHPARRGPC